ncbi:substrate-binding periplasmic protein [Chitinimonas naiadis]
MRVKHRHIRPYLITLALAAAATFAATLCPAQTVIYPRPETADDRRSDFPIELLKLALAQSRSGYTLQPSELTMFQSRSIAEVAAGTGRVHVLWSMTSREREQQLLAIRIPIDKGLLGWRVALVRQDDLARFASVRGASQLKTLNAGQGYDWPDLKILQFNGYRVTGSSSYDGLFKQLASGKIDYFPRSVIEVLEEAASSQSEGLAIEPTLLLHYPAARYFFVNKHNQGLATAIEQGLEAAIRNGSFEALFQRYHDGTIAQLNLNKRRVIELQNPLLPADTPLTRSELWFHQDARPAR